MTHEQNVISLQLWWIGQLKKIIKAEMDAEEKRKAREMAKNFKALEEYRSEDEILDAYGFGCITEKKKDKLIDLWMKREKADQEDPLYRDKMLLLNELYTTAKRILKEEGV